jgi:tetratricopeptide (TPR) repeat protein
LEKLPFLALGLAGVIFTRWLRPATAAPADAEISGYFEWFAQTLYSPVFYLWKTIAPFRLMPAYQLPEVMAAWQWGLFLGGVFVVTLAVGIFYRGSGNAAGPVAWLCYLTLVFAPRIQNGSADFHILADRFNYLPSTVLVGVAGAGLLRISRALKPANLSFLTLASGIGGGLFVLGALGILTWQQTGFWHDPEKLWRYSLSIDPQSRQARQRLAAGLIAQNKGDQALELYDTAVRNYPDSALAHADLARTLATKGQLDNALRHYGRALEINPVLPQALYGTGDVLVRRGEFHAAIEHYLKALKSAPSARIHVGLGYASGRLGRIDEAIDHYRSALRIDSINVDAYFNLASTLTVRGQLEEAIENYRKAVKILPSHSRAHYGLANVLTRQGSLKEAMEHYQEAINHNPEFAEAYLNVGIMLANQGQLDTAISYFRHALGIRPGFAEARLNLARALAAQGKKEEALREYEEVKRLMHSRDVPPAAR